MSLVSILIAIGVGIVLAIVLGVIYYKVNANINTTQRNLNKIENRLSAAGAQWLAGLFEDLIVGDVRSASIHCRQFIEADDVTGFFLDNIAVPLAEYSIKETASYYPEKFARLKALVESVNGVASK
jgi:hypothetical protein